MWTPWRIVEAVFSKKVFCVGEEPSECFTINSSSEALNDVNPNFHDFTRLQDSLSCFWNMNLFLNNQIFQQNDHSWIKVLNESFFHEKNHLSIRLPRKEIRTESLNIIAEANLEKGQWKRRWSRDCYWLIHKEGNWSSMILLIDKFRATSNLSLIVLHSQALNRWHNLILQMVDQRFFMGKLVEGLGSLRWHMCFENQYFDFTAESPFLSGIHLIEPWEEGLLMETISIISWSIRANISPTWDKSHSLDFFLIFLQTLIHFFHLLSIWVIMSRDSLWTIRV